jgi:hypothetical protein
VEYFFRWLSTGTSQLALQQQQQRKTCRDDRRCDVIFFCAPWTRPGQYRDGMARPGSASEFVARASDFADVLLWLIPHFRVFTESSSFHAQTTLFTLNENCFHLDFGVPTPPTNHENVR